jgi:outer membrane protein TolC
MQVRKAWQQLALSRARQRLITEALSDVKRLQTGAERLISAGLADPLDLGDLELERLNLHDQFLLAQTHEQESYDALLVLLGLHASHNWQFETKQRREPHSIPVDPDLANHPMLRIALAAHVVADKRLELAIRGQYPDLHLGLGIGVEDGDPRAGFGLGLLPLPIWNGNKEDIARSDAERVVAHADIEAALITLAQQRHRDARALTASSGRWQFIHDELAPKADHQRDEARRLAGLGQSDLFRIVDAVLKAHDIRLLLLDAEADVDLAHLNIIASNGPLAQP